MINFKKGKKGPVIWEEIVRKPEDKMCAPWKGWSLFKSTINEGRRSKCSKCGYESKGPEALIDVTLTDDMMIVQAKKCPKCEFLGLESFTIYKSNVNFWGDE